VEQRSTLQPVEIPHWSRQACPEGSHSLHRAHAGADFLAGTVAWGDPRWSSLLPKDCTPWKGAMSEQFVKDCSPSEGPTLEKVMKEFKLWEGPHVRAGEKCEKEEAAETCCELAAAPIPCAPASPGEDVEESGVTQSLGRKGGGGGRVF